MLPSQRKGVVWCVMLLLVVASPVAALEETFQDLDLSVEVAPVFTLSLDNSALTFGAVSPNTTMVLGRERFFNELRCRSNSGHLWYVKAHLVSLASVQHAQYTLPPDSLRWRVVESTGAPQVFSTEFQPFSTTPSVLYIGQPEDADGREVILRLQYSLTTSLNSPAGSYAGQLVFTLAEEP